MHIYIYLYIYIDIYLCVCVCNKVNDKEYTFFRNSEFHAALHFYPTKYLQNSLYKLFSQITVLNHRIRIS